MFSGSVNVNPDTLAESYSELELSRYEEEGNILPRGVEVGDCSRKHGMQESCKTEA